ncbi:MAG: hypothetical protein WCI55_00405 [Armatimonadota bacterium]
MGEWRPFLTSFVGSPKAECWYCLDRASEFFQIAFLVKSPAYMNPEISEAVVFEGLWHHDCGELWLGNAENGRYLEINLAPNGAHWTCAFVLPRLRDGDCRPPICTPNSHLVEETQWYSELRIANSEVERCLGSLDSLVGNVTLVLGGCDHPNEKLENLHSIVPLGAHDFHRPQDWVPLSNLI